jgi:PAS domain S-box-containing protein
VRGGPLWRGQLDGIVGEASFQRGDGASVSAEARADLLVVGGRTVGCLLQLRDVTGRKAAEATSRRNAETYRAVVRSVPDAAVLLFDHDLRYWFAEGGNLRRAGLDPHQLEGRTLPELLPPDRQQPMVGYFRAALRGETNTYVHTDGTGTPYELRIGPLRDREGSVIGGMLLTRDLTERERAQTELSRERDLATAVLDTSGALVVVLDREGRVVRFNRTCEQLSGLSSDEVLGRPFWEFMIPLDELVASKASFGRLTAGDYPSSHESSFIARDGDLRTIVWTNTALVDADGEVEYVIGTGIDMTDQHLAKEELAETQAKALVEAERFAAVLRAATGYAIIGTDLAGRINVYNEGAERMLGWVAREVIGQFTLDALLDPAEVAASAATLGVRPGFEVLVTRARRGRPETREWTSVRADSSRLPVSLSVSPMRDDQGKLRGFIGIAEDITRRRQVEADAERLLLLEQTARANSDAAAAAMAIQNERLRELDSMKDEFVSTVSHELRTPLTSMHGSLELLLEGDVGPVSDRQRHFLKVIDRNSRRLLRLVDDLLFVASSGAGKLALDLREADLNQLVGDRAELLRPSAVAKSLELVVAAEPLPAITADPERLAQLIDHLVSNAVKFTPDGGRVEVSTRRCGELVVLRVADNGIGIPSEQLGNLFQRFARAPAASEQAVQGTGLGLVITKAITEAHGGTIEVSSTEGAGSVFEVTLPSRQRELGAEQVRR